MKNQDILQYVEKVANDADHSFLSYNSLTEEALKVAVRARDSKRPLIVVKENAYLANRMRDILVSYFDDDEITAFLPEESMRAEEIASSFENRAARLISLYKMIRSDRLKIILCSPYGLIRHLPKKEELEEKLITIRRDDVLNREELIERLLKLGYEKTNHVETPMTFASRGFIVDVFSVNYDKPLRIEFFDDVIDSIRLFDHETQRTLERIDEAEICFAKDVFFSDEEKSYLKENVPAESGQMELDLEYISSDIYRQSQYFYCCYFERAHLKDYFPDACIYLSDEEKIDAHLKMLSDETFTYIQEMHEEHKLPLRFYVFGEFKREVAQRDLLTGKPFSQIPRISEIDFPYGTIDYITNVLKNEKSAYKLVVVDEKHFEEIVNSFLKMDIPYSICTGDLSQGINMAYGDVYGGFTIAEEDLSVYTVKELFKNRPRSGRYANRYGEARALNSYEELKRGDYVVHDQYGIGQFVAIESRVINGVECDYLKIIYKGNDELLVPLSQFSLVRKYVSKEGVVPKLHKLGSKEWAETKRRVEENVNDIAAKLIELYSVRDTDIGFAFSEDSPMQKEFEDTFEYELTDDQVKAIAEVKADMEKAKPMDRLLCGDVGFGKTEVAIRAAFKAVNDDKQVAYLCPTTILSFQHFDTFRKRFEDFPVRVEVLNRYIPEDRQKKILRDLKEGRVDILIGTHRILSKDIEYKDLGLLIIDEEQRFGVEHKEKIKELKNSIDVLSLSATPIPRTLQMSLIGIRGLSTLDTPPNNRYPVQTYVVHKNENLVEEVIMRELERDGQVFYLFNNVEMIYSLARKVQQKLPYARVGVAHGQMDRKEIEDIMYRFYQNEINVLICTTIIETGLDIPNANTIIVDNAQNFGLAQLYQIKGRVGRSDRIAYAYLMIPEKKQLTESSTKRLEAIKEFTSLGSGYKIAMRDLTIRGAGDLLGEKQSGFIDNVGLDLYLAMLNKAIQKAKGIETEEEEKTRTNVSIPISSYIPDSFSDNDYDKLSLYHELYDIDNKEDLFDYYLKITDEYGKLPKEVEALFDKKKLELLCNLNLIDKVSNIKGRFTIVLSKEYSDRIDGVKLFEFVNSISKDMVITYRNSKLAVSLDNQKENVSKMLKLVDNLDKLEKNADR
ncbi:MAG: transcription-repair coupling factor [Erysipelotrichaceae bacterium]|nr:transcription-repair coupling factor [Erysipelotrichaceae bacterium]